MTTTAKTTLQLIAHSAQALQPSARGFAIAATLRELCELAGDLPLDLADAHAGYDLLCRAKPDDAPAIVSRRNTCYELAQICRAYTEERGDPMRLARVLDRVSVRLAQATMGPREQAIHGTCAREAGEIQAAVEQAEGSGA